GPGEEATVFSPQSGARRLSRNEYDNTVEELLHDSTRPASQLLPEDAETPFDNDVATQVASPVLVEVAETLAEQVAQRALSTPSVRAELVTCAPVGAGDTACLADVVKRFGRRALRRPLADEEVARFVDLDQYAIEAGDFYYGVELVLRAMLQHP